MAIPIPLESPSRDVREELRARLESAPLDHAEALLAGYQVLQRLHDSGVLDAALGILGSGDKVLGTLVEAASSPASTRGLRNCLVLIKTLGQLDPDLFGGFLLALAEALRRTDEQAQKPPGLLSILNRLRDDDSRRGVSMVTSLLEAWGKNANPESARTGAATGQKTLVSHG